jgi:hypothetical protein
MKSNCQLTWVVGVTSLLNFGFSGVLSHGAENIAELMSGDLVIATLVEQQKRLLELYNSETGNDVLNCYQWIVAKSNIVV